MKIYTKTGDEGETGLFSGGRVRKNHPRVEAYGTIDELNSVLGLARSHGVDDEIDVILQRIQSELLVVGAELACAAGQERSLSMDLVTGEAIARLEREIDNAEEQLPPLRHFILPSGCPAGAALHLARTVCRRAERRILDLSGVRRDLTIYVNRLSDHLFVMARRVNHRAHAVEIPWSATPGG
jgi:cob(I)alamin adenosyltransferase